MSTQHILWTEKYRPKTVDECILPERLKLPFMEYVRLNTIPNLLLSGGAGVGKTTIAKAMCNEIGCDFIVINGSDESGIDTFRTKIKQYASSMSLTGGRKVIIIDEADYLNPNSTQPALRNAMEEFAGNCFHRNTKILTIEHGPIEIGNIYGQTVRVKCMDGVWRPTTIQSYGKQPLYKYKFGKFNSSEYHIHQEVIATKNHTWFLEDGSKTTNLSVGDKLLLPKTIEEMDRQGIIHGMIFGDGYGHHNSQHGTVIARQGRTYSTLRLCKQDKVQKEMFDILIQEGCTPHYPKSANGDPVFQCGFIPYSKEFPFTNDPAYISGFIYGWWLADGYKEFRNRLQISTIRTDAVEWLENYAAYAGYQITGHNIRPSGDGGYPNSKELHILTLSRIQTPCVRSIDYFGEDEVFCLEEPETNSFVLANGLLTGNCSFIFTANFKQRIIDPLHSRCSVVDFSLKSAEKQKMAAAFFERVQTILKNENVDFDKKVLAEFIKRFFPDFRRIINELQRYSQFGKIDTGILVHLGDVDINQIIQFMKEKDFGSLRKWVASHEIEPQVFYRKLYDNLYEVMKKDSIPQAVLILADYQYKQAFVADHEINTMACLTELMMQCEFL